MKQWYSVNMAAPKAAEIFIYDHIGKDWWGDGSAVEAKKFIKDVKALGDLDNITLRINSPGGAVFEGNAIYNFLQGLSATITVHIDGLAASMASVIAMVGDEVIMPANAMLMIHNPLSIVVGNAEEMRKRAEMLDKLKEGAITAYEGKSAMERSEIAKLMDEETWMTADEAVTWGFADKVAESSNIAANFDLSTFKNVPTQAIKVFNSVETSVNAETLLLPEPEEPRHMDKETLMKQHPELVKDIKQEGHNEGFSAGKAEGIKTESERIKAIEELPIKGHETLVETMKFDGKTAAPDIAMAILKAEKVAREVVQTEMAQDAPAPIKLEQDDSEVTNHSHLPVKERCEKIWNSNPKIREQFSSLDSFTAYEKGIETGRIKPAKTA